MNVTSDAMSYISGGTYDFGNIKCLRITRALTPGFPYEAVVISKSKSEISNFSMWQQISKDKIKKMNIELI